MKKYALLTLLLICFSAADGWAQTSSLDELYRDIVRSDNRGYLPLFVKNRSIPDILVEEELLKKNLNSEQPEELKEPIPAAVKLTDNREQLKQAELEARQHWLDVLTAVKENRVTPLELEEISNRAAKSDPHAVEVLAWMYARGVGVKPDLLQSFSLYQKAAALQVPQASDNALKVYKSMTPEQRRRLNGLSR